MKLEDKQALALIQENKLGHLKFLRYSLSLNTAFKADEKQLLAEIFHFITQSTTAKITQLTASDAPLGRATLVTAAFEEDIMANIFIGYAPSLVGYHKSLEVVGSRAMYQYNSEKDDAFSTSFLKADYVLNHDLTLADYSEWFRLMERSHLEIAALKEDIR